MNRRTKRERVSSRPSSNASTRTELTQGESSQPVLRLSNVGSQRLQHDTRVLSGDLLSSLSKIERHVSSSFPESKKLRSETVRDSQVVEGFRTTFRKTLEEGRHSLRVSDADGLGEEVGVLRERGRREGEEEGQRWFRRCFEELRQGEKNEPCWGERSGRTRRWDRSREGRRGSRALRCRTTREPEEL